MMQKRILVLTSGYKRSTNDLQYLNDFVCILTERLAKHFDVSVLAPGYKNSKKNELINGVHVFRHRQFIFKNISLAYGSGILPNVKKNKLLLFTIPFFVFFQFLSLATLMKKYRFEAIHAHWIIPQGFVAAVYKFLFRSKVRLIVTAHGADILEDDFSAQFFLKRHVLKFILSQCDSIAVTNNVIKKIVQKSGYENKIHVYPMGIDTNYFNPTYKNKEFSDGHGLKPRINLLFVGALIERKGIHNLIEAIPLVTKSIPQLALHVLGEGNLRPVLEKRILELGISNKVFFKGYVTEEEKRNYFANSDFFVFPTHSEGFGLVIIEAMSSSLVPIVSDLEVLKDYLNDGENSITIKGFTPESIAQSILRALNLPKNDLLKIKDKAREDIVRKYDWNTVEKNYSTLISDTI